MKWLRRHRKWKRTLLLLLLLLTGGAIVNVAVAWGCCLCSPMGAFSPEQHGVGYTLLGVTTTKFREPYPINDNPPTIEDGIAQAGWPLRTLTARVDIIEHLANEIRFRMGLPPSPSESRAVMQYGCLVPRDWLPSWTYPYRRVPLHPLWPGFAVNTIFYAVILWLLFTFPFALRRRRRIKRGLCPACAYPIGTSPVCTECGKPVNSLPLEGEGKGGGESCDGTQMSGRAIDAPPSPLPGREGET